MARKPVAPCIGEGMVTRRLLVHARDVVYLKGIVEASEGIAQVFGEKGGELTLASPVERAAELDALVKDLCDELGAMILA